MADAQQLKIERAFMDTFGISRRQARQLVLAQKRQEGEALRQLQMTGRLSSFKPDAPPKIEVEEVRSEPLAPVLVGSTVRADDLPAPQLPGDALEPLVPSPAGTYTAMNATVDEFGRVTFAESSPASNILVNLAHSGGEALLVEEGETNHEEGYDKLRRIAPRNESGYGGVGVARASGETAVVLWAIVTNVGAGTGIWQENTPAEGVKLRSLVESDRIKLDLITDGTEIKPDVKDASIDTAQLADGAVDNDKLATDAVTDDKVLDGTLTLQKLADNGASEGSIIQYTGGAWVAVDAEWASVTLCVDGAPVTWEVLKKT